MTRGWKLSYQIRGDRKGGPSVASIACGEGCGRVDTKTVTGNMNPEMIKKHFERQGWDFDLTNPRRCICPACKEKPKTMTAAQPPAPARRVTDTPRPLTQTEKLKARALLDKHFDDGKGMYLDRKSDALLAAEINVPSASFAHFREFAYGPIQISPELTAALDDFTKLRVEHSQIGDEIANLGARHRKTESAINEAIARIQKLG